MEQKTTNYVESVRTVENQPLRLETSAIRQLVLSLSLFSLGLLPPFVARATGVKSLIRFIARIKVGKEARQKGERREKRRERERRRKAAHVSRDIGCRLLSVIKRGKREKSSTATDLYFIRASRIHTAPDYPGVQLTDVKFERRAFNPSLISNGRRYPRL